MSQDKIALNYQYLSSEELMSFHEWQDSEQTELPLVMGVRFYSLFLNGNSCEDIVRLNPGVTLGQVVHARLAYDWDKRKEAYLADLLTRTEQRHRQVAMETINFISDLLAVNNVRYGSRLKKFLVTQKEEDLGDLAIGLKQFQEMAQLHQKLAGTEGTKRQVVSGEVVVTHKNEDSPMDPEDAGSLIAEMLEDRKS